MLMDKTDTGGPRTTVFGGFEEFPDYVEGNPLQARFMKFLQFAVNNVRAGKIPRLSTVERRPESSVSIGVGRSGIDEPGTGISPDLIPARTSHDAEFDEMVRDIQSLLKKQESASGLPLVRFFVSMMAGARTEQQSKQFGDRAMRSMRTILKQVVQEYAAKTGNYLLSNLMSKYEDFQSNKPMPFPRQPVKTVKPTLAPGKDKDFASFLAVIDRFDGRPVGSSILGKYRRRFLEYPPRTSGYRNRLEETLALMTQEGVLKAIPTGNAGAVVYVAGPNANRYRQLGDGLPDQ